MSKKTSFREEAQQAFSRGDWKKALDNYQKHCEGDPNDARSQLKIGELLERLGKREEAVEVYRRVAETYAQDGFLLQAISVLKVILRVDPTAKEISERLAQLYLEKTREPKPLRPFSHIPLFSELQEEELQLLLRQIRVRALRAGSLICREGEAGDSLLILSRGEAAVTKRTATERETGIRDLKAGDFFGEFGFFTDRKRHATVMAKSDCEILEISRTDLNHLIKRYSRVKEVLQNLFRQRVLDLFLALSPLFAPLASPEREEVSKRFRPRKVLTETLLFARGDPPESLYMVKSGEVEIFTQNSQGKKVVVSRMGSGNFFGEIGPLSKRSRTASARATQATELLELTREDLEACLTRFPRIREILKEISFRRVVRMNEILSQEKIEKTKEGMV